MSQLPAVAGHPARRKGKAVARATEIVKSNNAGGPEAERWKNPERFGPNRMALAT